MKYQLLVLDIDGTTVDSNKHLPQRTADALIDLQNTGVRVVLASGRPTLVGSGTFWICVWLGRISVGRARLLFALS